MATENIRFGVYDAQSIIVTVQLQNSVVQITGFAEGDYVQVTPVRNESKLLHGAEGHTIIQKSAVRGVNISLELFAISPANRLLSYLEESARDNIFSISIASPDTNESGYARRASVIDRPVLSVGESAGTRSWLIHAHDWRTGNIDFNEE